MDKEESDENDSHLDEFKEFCQKDCTTNRDVRSLRNLAEKQRRDKLNGYINELANSVPLVTISSKRLDKTSVLRLSAAYLRLNKTALNLKRSRNKFQANNSLWRPKKFNLNYLKQLLESVEGFIIVTTGNGKIIYVSHSVENFLGHQNIEMIGHSLTSFLHPNDIDTVYNQIQKAHEQVSKGSQTSDKIYFQCRLREKNQPRSEVITYQMVQVSGHISISEIPKDSIDENNPGCSKCGDNEDKSENNILFKGFVQIIPTNPMAELSLMDANLDEYVSRHSLDATLLFADHRISGIIGFSPSEVIGKSAYDWILPDDHSIALFAQKLMLSNSNGTGCIVHRLKTKNGSYVFLQSSGCLQYDKNGQIDHWVCVSRLLVENEGDKEREKFVKRFTPHIYNISPTALYESLQIVIGSRGSNSNFGATNAFGDSNPSNSVRIQEIDTNVMPSQQQQQSVVSYSDQLKNDLIFTSSSNRTQSSVQMTLKMDTNEVIGQSQHYTSSAVQSPIVNSVSNYNEPYAQSSGFVQIQTLPIFPAQIITQQTSDSVNSFDNLSLKFNNNNNNNNNNSISNNNVINFYAPTSVSLSHIDQKNTELNNSSLYANNTVNSVLTPVPKPANDLTHLLGATVLTFDHQQRPVLSVYSPSIALEEVSRINHNQNQNNVNINSSSKFNCADSSDISSPLETSFYSPLDSNCDDLPNESQLTLNGLNYEELSNHSTNSLLSFSFPSNDSQSDFGLIEDQLIEENLLQDPCISSNGSSFGKRRSGEDANEAELDRTVEIKTSIFDLQNSETNASTLFSS